MGWRFIKLFGAGAGIITAVLALVLAALIAGFFQQTSAGLAFWAAGRAAGYGLACEEFEGNVFSSFVCRGFTASDAEGVFFRAAEVEFGWQLLPALSRRLNIEHLRITNAELSRQPTGEESTEPFALPTWPDVSISFQEFALNRFVVNIPDAPVVCLNGSGNAEVVAPVMTVEMQFARCEGEGAVTALIRIADGSLSLDINAMDDGALADLLLGWDGAGATDIRLVGAGPLEAFSGTLNSSIENGGTVTADIATIPGGAIGVNGLSINGAITLAEGRAPEWAPATNGSIAARLFLPDEGGMRVDDGNIIWGNTELNFSAAQSEDGALSGQLDAMIGAFDGVVVFQSANLSLALTGDGENQNAAGTYVLNGLCADTICAQRLEGTLQAMVANDAASFSTEGNATALRMAGIIDEILGNTTSYTISGNYVFADEALTFDGLLDGAQGDLAANGEMTLGDVVAGAGIADVTLNANAMIGGMTLAESVRLTAELENFSGDGAASGTLTLISQMLAANGHFAIGANGALEAQLATTRADPERLSTMTGMVFTGAPSLGMNVSGTMDAPVIAAEAALPGLDAGGFSLTEAAFILNAQRSGGAWSGETSLDAQSSAGVIDLTAAISGPDGAPVEITVADDSHIADAQLRGNVSIPQDGAAASGRLVLSGNPLSPVGVYLDSRALSDGTITLTLETRDEAEIAELAVALTDVTLEGQLQGATIDGTLLYNLTTQNADGEIAVADDENHLRLVADGSFTEDTLVTVQSFEGEWSAIPIRLIAPFSLRQSEETITISDAEFDVGGGRAQFSGTQTVNGVDGRLALIAVPVAPLVELAGFQEAQGQIDAELTVRMTPTLSEGRLTFTADDFAFANIERDLLPADLRVTGNWDGNAFTANGELSGLDDAPASFTLSLPLRRRGGGYAVAIDNDGPISGTFNGTARAERFLALLPLAEHSLTGAISAAVRVDGTLADPHFSGEAHLADGTYESLQFGTRFEEVALSLDATPDGAFALDVSATDGGAGRVAVTGRTTFGENGQPVGEANVTITNAYLLRRDEYTVRGSGNVAIAFPEGQTASIAGMFRTAEVRVNMGQPLPPGVQEIAVIEINRPAELGALEAEDESQEADFISVATLDLNVVMPNNVRVEGYGVNSEWQGEINIDGTVGAPVIGGELNLVRGFAEFLGREFTLDSGRVVPDSNAAGGARVAIMGSHEQNDLRVNLNITGAAAMPQIEWSSVPALPRDEIISRLYFGKASPQLSAYEAIQLAQLSGALGGFGGGGGVLDFARRVTSLDVLRIEPPAGGDIANPSVTVGKYVTERVYIGARRDAETSSSAIEVQIEVTPHIAVQVETGSDNSQAAGVNWQWDY